MSLAASYSIAAIFSAKDKLSPAISKIEKRYGRFAGNVGRVLGRMNKVVNRALKIGATVALAGVIAFTGMAVREFIALDDAVTQAGAKFVDLDTRADSYAQSLDAIQRKSRQVASVTEFMAADAAGALDKFAMAGLASDVAMSLLMGTTNLATAAGTDLTTAVDIATDSMGAFGLAMDNAADAEKNLNRVSDVFAKTTTTANTDLNMLFESVTAGASAFTAAGQELETFAAFTGVLANAGIKGGAAGTSLRNVMLRLAKPTGEAADVLEALNVKTADAEGNFRDAVDILADFEKGLKGMGSQQRTAALATVFGARTVTGINILLAEGSDELRKYRGELINSAGASEQMANAMRMSLKNQLAILKSSVTELGLQFVQAFEKDGRGALERLITGVQNFDMTPIIEGARTFADILISMKPTVDALIAGMLMMSKLIKPAIKFLNFTSENNLIKALQGDSPFFEGIKDKIFSRARSDRADVEEFRAAQRAIQAEDPRFNIGGGTTEQERLKLAPNAASEESKSAQVLRGEGTITVKSEDGVELEVDNGSMNDAGWDMHELGKDTA